MSSENLLSISPSTLQFPFELNSMMSCCIQLTNNTDLFVAFKFKVTMPNKYTVCPNTGIILPGSTLDVTITMAAQTEAPVDMLCEDKFLVRSSIARDGATAEDITAEMFENSHVVEEFKMPVFFIPLNPPSVVQEGSSQSLEDGKESPPMSSTLKREREVSTIPKLYSLREASQHCTKEDCWTVIHGKVYDVTKFLDDHPGGDDVLLSVAGRDSTEEFEDVEHTDSARELMEEYAIGELDTSPAAIAELEIFTKLYSMQEVSQHSTKEDCWIVIDGKVYDVTKFLDEHPGGDDVLLSVAGRDSTEDFEDVGHSNPAKEIMEQYAIGELDKSLLTIAELEILKVMERFQELFSQREFKEAAELAADSPRGILRTPEILAQLKSAPVSFGETPPLVAYFGALLKKGKVNAFETLELSRMVVNQNQKSLLEGWLAQDKLECSEELGDFVKTVDDDLALKIYIRARVTPKVIAACAERMELDKIPIYLKEVGDEPDYRFLLLTILRSNPQGAVKFALMMSQMEGGCPIDYNLISDLFLQRNLVREATAFLLDVLKPNLPEHGLLQTKVLEINLVNYPNVADDILANGMFSHYDRPRIGQLCENAGLYMRALQHYTEPSDIKRVIANAHAIEPQALVEFFRTLSRELALECMKELMLVNLSGNLQIVVQTAKEYSEQYGVEACIKLFEQFESYEGLYLFLGSFLSSSEDPEIRFIYIEAAAKAGKVKRVTRESNFYDAVKTKNFLMEAKLPDATPLKNVSDRLLQQSDDKDNLETRRRSNGTTSEGKGSKSSIRRQSSNEMSSIILFNKYDIEAATDGLRDSSKIGQGGYGGVYRGYIGDNEVAIKMLDSNSQQGIHEFLQEMEVLGQMRHPNLVKLIGACVSLRALVYEFLPNGSLGDCLRKNPRLLTWQMRTRIVYQICSALTFLHSRRPHPLVHGDLKPANILLDADFNSKLADFGLCRFLPEGTTSLAFLDTTPKGTLGYIDPEFMNTGILTPECDLYSYGVTILRLLTGMEAVGIGMKVRIAYKEKSLMTMVDPTAGNWPTDVSEFLAYFGLKCCAKKKSSDLIKEIARDLEDILADIL